MIRFFLVYLMCCTLKLKAFLFHVGIAFIYMLLYSALSDTAEVMKSDFESQIERLTNGSLRQDLLTLKLGLKC